MQIGKISFSGLEQTQTKSEIKKEDVKKETPVEDTEKSKAAKYMIGAAALAGVVAVGIIGHKNNWWRKAQEVGEDLAKKGSNAVQGSKHKVCITVDDFKVKSNVIQTPNAQPEEALNSLPNGKQNLNTEILDFSNIQGEKFMRNSCHVISQKDQNGNVIKEFVSRNGWTLHSIIDYNPKTGKRIKGTVYKADYLFTNADDMSVNFDDLTIDCVIDYHPATGKRVKITSYRPDGITIDSIIDNDPATERKIRETVYKLDGKNINSVTDYDPATKNMIRKTMYNDYENYIDYVNEYDRVTGNKIRETSYRDNNNISTIYDYDRVTGNKIRVTHYQYDGKTLYTVLESDPITGLDIKKTYYTDDGKEIERVKFFDSKGNTRKVEFYKKGKLSGTMLM